jgi:hypothetical protein
MLTYYCWGILLEAKEAVCMIILSSERVIGAEEFLKMMSVARFGISDAQSLASVTRSREYYVILHKLKYQRISNVTISVGRLMINHSTCFCALPFSIVLSISSLSVLSFLSLCITRLRLFYLSFFFTGSTAPPPGTWPLIFQFHDHFYRR